MPTTYKLYPSHMLQHLYIAHYISGTSFTLLLSLTLQLQGLKHTHFSLYWHVQPAVWMTMPAVNKYNAWRRYHITKSSHKLRRLLWSAFTINFWFVLWTFQLSTVCRNLMAYEAIHDMPLKTRQNIYITAAKNKYACVNNKAILYTFTCIRTDWASS